MCVQIDTDSAREDNVLSYQQPGALPVLGSSL